MFIKATDAPGYYVFIPGVFDLPNYYSEGVMKMYEEAERRVFSSDEAKELRKSIVKKEIKC